MNKRGLSNIIATVLIILLALAAVAIVWQFIQPIFTQSGTNIELQNKCLDALVEPVSCSYDDNVDLTAIIKQSEGDIQQISFVVELEDGNRAVQQAAAPGIYNTQTATFTSTEITTKPVNLQGAAQLTASDGTTFTCEIAPVEKTCEIDCSTFNACSDYDFETDCTENPCDLNAPNSCDWSGGNCVGTIIP